MLATKEGRYAYLMGSSDPHANAYASYFHEVIHWWQHIGTTLGFLTGLCVPLQAHTNLTELKELIQTKYGLVKPLRDKVSSGPSDINTVVNNWMDMEFSYALLNYPRWMHSRIRREPFFESHGHGLSILFGSAIENLAHLFDPTYKSLPCPDIWYDKFKQLKEKRELMFFSDSPTQLPPFGMHAITEAQARFQEIQWRYLAAETKPTWDDFKEEGLLGADYTEAFEAFLTITESDYPKDPLSNIVNMFHLICDVALNSSPGYPNDIVDYSRFIDNVSPGVRFIQAANVVRRNPNLLSLLECPDKESYKLVTNAICGILGWDTPYRVASCVLETAERMPGLKEFQREIANWEYKHGNMPLRYIYGRHISLMRDKALFPEYFCWPAIHFSSFGSLELHDAFTLFEKHMPPFVVHSIPGTVKSNMPDCSDPKKQNDIVCSYFVLQVIYDIVRQWIVRRGGFVFNYSWWDSIEKTELAYILPQFELIFGCELDAIKA